MEASQPTTNCPLFNPCCKRCVLLWWSSTSAKCSLLAKPMIKGISVHTFVHGAQPPAECAIGPTNSRESRVFLKSYLNSLNWAAESWTGMGWVAAFFCRYAHDSMALFEEC